MHPWVVTDKAGQVLRITGKYDRRTGSERSGGHESVHRVARVEPVGTQQIAGAGRDNTIRVDDRQVPQCPVDAGAAGARARHLSDYRSRYAGPAAQPLHRDEHRLRPTTCSGPLAGKCQCSQCLTVQHREHGCLRTRRHGAAPVAVRRVTR